MSYNKKTDKCITFKLVNLKKIASEHKVKGYSKMNKSKLCDELINRDLINTDFKENVKEKKEKKENVKEKKENVKEKKENVKEKKEKEKKKEKKEKEKKKEKKEIIPSPPPMNE